MDNESIIWSKTLLSKQSLEILIDLVEIKLGALQVQDREDARELRKIEACRKELLSSAQKKNPARGRHLEQPASGGLQDGRTADGGKKPLERPGEHSGGRFADGGPRVCWSEDYRTFDTIRIGFVPEADGIAHHPPAVRPQAIAGSHDGGKRYGVGCGPFSPHDG